MRIAEDPMAGRRSELGSNREWNVGARQGPGHVKEKLSGLARTLWTIDVFARATRASFYAQNTNQIQHQSCAQSVIPSRQEPLLLQIQTPRDY